MAIKTYKKALDESSNPLIHSALGWCYSEIGINEKAVEQYRIAFSKKRCTEIAVGLAYAEYSIGNINAFQKVYQYLNESKADLTPEYKDELSRLMKMRDNINKTNDSMSFSEKSA